MLVLELRGFKLLGGTKSHTSDECNTQLADLKKQMSTARGTSLNSLKQRALQVLRRRKMYDQQLGSLMNQQFNVDQVAFATESMQDTMNTVSKRERLKLQ